MARAKTKPTALSKYQLLRDRVDKKLTLANTYLEDGALHASAIILREAADVLDMAHAVRKAYLEALAS